MSRTSVFAQGRRYICLLMEAAAAMLAISGELQCEVPIAARAPELVVVAPAIKMRTYDI